MNAMCSSQTPHVRLSIEGQSNGEGRGIRSELATAPLSSDAGLAAFDAAAFSRVLIFNEVSGNYEALQNGSNQQAFDASSFGPEFGIAVRWMRETTRGNLYIDKYAISGTPISGFQNGGGSFFTTAGYRKITQDAWLASRHISIRDVGWLWVQGEADFAATQSYYQSALDTLISSRLSAARQRPGSLRVLAQMVPGMNLYSAEVVAAKASYAASNPISTRLVTYGSLFNGDNVHLSARGQLQLAYDAFEQIFSKSHLTA